jgi:hypothetical protein
MHCTLDRPSPRASRALRTPFVASRVIPLGFGGSISDESAGYIERVPCFPMAPDAVALTLLPGPLERVARRSSFVATYGCDFGTLIQSRRSG